MAVDNPHAGAKQASPALGFLDERAPAPPQQVVRAVDADGLRARLLAAATDEDVFSRLLEALQPAAARLAIFLLRGGVLVAHRGHGIDPRALQLARLPIADSPELVKLLEAATPYVGPLPSQLGSLFQQAGAPNGLCLPITLGKRAIGVLVAGMIDPALAQQGLLLLRIATMVDLALHAGHVRARLAKA